MITLFSFFFPFIILIIFFISFFHFNYLKRKQVHFPILLEAKLLPLISFYMTHMAYILLLGFEGIFFKYNLKLNIKISLDLFFHV